MGLFSGPSQTTAQVAASVAAPAHSVSLQKGSGPANDRVSIEKAAPDLVKKFDKAGISLNKRGLDGVRAEVVMLLDHSGSMGYDYENGTVQTLVERALGFALQIDSDGKIPVIRFDSNVKKPIEVTLQNYANVAQQKLYERNKMGLTRLDLALAELLKYAKRTTAPIFAIIVTDGNPSSHVEQATALVRELANYPVFLKFLAIQPVSYLQELDDMDGRLIDNADAKYIPNPAGVADLAFADDMTDEWPTWIVAAGAVGLLS